MIAEPHVTLRLPLVLASQSPRRRELLRDAGYPFSVQPARIREPDSSLRRATAAQLAEALAYFKARNVAGSLREPAVVLGADTVVAVGSRIINKAADEDQARLFLRLLSGTTHRVITGVALLNTEARSRLIRRDVTRITMRTMSDADIDAYVATGAWRDKAGGYAIQEGGDQFVERIDGSWTNVVGLPMELIDELLTPYRTCGSRELHAAAC